VRKSDRYLDAHIESDAQRSGYNVHQARSKSETGARVDQFGVAFAHDFAVVSFHSTFTPLRGDLRVEWRKLLIFMHLYSSP
jgi:hypothetical protein